MLATGVGTIVNAALILGLAPVPNVADFTANHTLVWLTRRRR
jgi:hypothetical protein